MSCIYLLDANIFIEAKNTYYGFDTVPAFWKWLDLEQQNGQLASIEPIRDELLKGKDELADWATVRKEAGWFLPVWDEPTQLCFTQIANWVINEPYYPRAIADFLDIGDSWLIAKALTLDATIVTHETLQLDCRRRVKIPNVCRAFGIAYMDVFDLIRQSGVKFDTVF